MQRPTFDTSPGLDLEPIKQMLAKATPGPWYWDGVIENKSVGLTAAHSGHHTVMGFARWGMNGAAPEFRVDGWMKRVDELAIPRQSHRPDGAFYEINHPDAELIANTPMLLQACVAEIERLNRVIKDEVAKEIGFQERGGWERVNELEQENQRMREALTAYESECMCRVKGEGRCERCTQALAALQGGDKGD